MKCVVEFSIKLSSKILSSLLAVRFSRIAITGSRFFAPGCNYQLLALLFYAVKLYLSITSLFKSISPRPNLLPKTIQDKSAGFRPKRVVP